MSKTDLCKKTEKFGDKMQVLNNSLGVLIKLIGQNGLRRDKILLCTEIAFEAEQAAFYHLVNFTPES